VLFGDHAAVDPIVVNSRMMTAFAPPQGPGLVDVTVITDTGQVTVLGAFTYADPAEPEVEIVSISPAHGAIEGGTLVTIEGENFSPDTAVKFGDVLSEEVSFVNSQLLTAVTPPHVAGAVDVQVLSNGNKDSIEEAFFFGPMLDDGSDSDGDGLTDVQEITGWQVWIDSFSQAQGGDTYFTSFTYVVTSDPNDDDTDDDGLTDDVEFLIKSDPRNRDSDDDGLWDEEEWNRWLTSPTSVDTDGDARGNPDAQLAPNQALFDGLELFDPAVLRLPPGDPNDPENPRQVKALATSPTLEDSDGDGVSDAEEFDSTVRNGLIADLPRLEYELVGDVDVRLNVEYAESEGETKEYGETLTESETDTVSSSFSATHGWSFDFMFGVEGIAKAGLIEYGETSTKTELTIGVHGEYTYTTANESSLETSKESSRLQSDSREFTETAADGSIRTAIELTNPGNTTFTLNDLSILVSQIEKLKEPCDTSSERPLKTIATMTPVFDTVTLAPGETAGPFELAATSVNTDAIKELLANPDTLILGTASTNFSDSSGLVFDFIRQFTVAQTATIVIDFGDDGQDVCVGGTEDGNPCRSDPTACREGLGYCANDGGVRTYTVATNVDRNPDGTYRGVSMQSVPENMLGFELGDPVDGYATGIEPETGTEVIESLLGRKHLPRDKNDPKLELLGSSHDFWSLLTNNADHLDSNFNEMILHAGEVVALFFCIDDDNDGLCNTHEKDAGTDQIENPLFPDDADGDGLTDREEYVEGWIAYEDPDNPIDPDSAPPHPDGFAFVQVFSSPTATDTDGDGLDDFMAKFHRSDPNNPDSDGDELLDGQDPFPTRRAKTLFVQEGGVGTGTGFWNNALPTIQEALEIAANGQLTPEPDDDVSQIWVARGTYQPSFRLEPIVLLNDIKIYGGFSGQSEGFLGETKRGQRNTDAFTNGCVISGDLGNNDLGAIVLDEPVNIADNCPVVVAADGSIDSSALRDGFMITGAYATEADDGGALSLLGSPTIQNCLITGNGNQRGGAGVFAGGASAAQFKACILADNIAHYGGGAYITSTGNIVFEDCEFSQNEARERPQFIPQVTVPPNDWAPVGGGAYLLNTGRVDFNRCAFTGNEAYNQGGVIAASGNGPAYLRVDSCRFHSNSTTAPWDWTGDTNYRSWGGGIYMDANGSVSNSEFWDNRAWTTGGGIAVVTLNQGDQYVAITNCSFAQNRALWPFSPGSGIMASHRMSLGSVVDVTIENTIAVQNDAGVEEIPEFSDDEAPVESDQVYNDWVTGFPARITVRNSCFNKGGTMVYSEQDNNIDVDPSLESLELGNLSLGDQSPCIDRGNSFVDLDPLLPGFQLLPDLDLAGKPRVADGNSDGIVSVAIGAFEAPAREDGPAPD
jgi:hypothetical protein